MSLEHNNPDMVCDRCYNRVDTTFDGDNIVATVRGWGENNMIYPLQVRARSNMTDEQIRQAGEAAPFEHLCPDCIEHLGLDLESDVPMIACYDYNYTR